MDFLDIKSMEELKRSYRDGVGKSIAGLGGSRESRWTESIAVGSKVFVEKTKAELGIKAMGREVMGVGGVYELKEGEVSYNPDFAGENRGLRVENSYFGNLSI